MSKPNNQQHYPYPPPGYWPYYPPPASHSEGAKEPRKATNRKGCSELAAEFVLFTLAILIFIMIVYLTTGGPQ